MSAAVCEDARGPESDNCDKHTFVNAKAMEDRGAVSSIDSLTLTSSSKAFEDSRSNTTENGFGDDEQTENLSEDFIIVENPEFYQNSNTVHLGPTVTGVVNDILPPPRTLDDVPLRKRGRKKSTPYVKKTKTKRCKSPTDTCSDEDWSKASKHPKGELSTSQSDQSIENERNNDSFPSTSETVLNLNLEENVVEVKRSASYGLRRKFQSIDFSYDNDDDPFLQEVEEILVKPYICSECQVCFPTKRALQQHQISAHDHYKCELCGSNFTTMLGLKRHCHVKHNQPEYEQDKTHGCSECEFNCTNEKELRHHQISEHRKGKEHVCDFCGKDYATLLGLQKHTALQHSKTECAFCNKSFKLGKALIDHVKVCGREFMPPEFNGIKVAKPKIFPCKYCNKKFSERGNRTRHMRIHLGILKFTCEHCGKKCSEKHALLSHIRHIHTGERPYSCDTCPRSFATVSDLRRHQVTVHSDLRRYTCSDCGKSFKTRGALKVHSKAERGEKSWQCGVCSKQFVSKGGLKAHMVVHSGIKMYECETCQRQFAHKASLEAHVRVHTGLMPYICPKCGKKFAHLQNRNRHLRTMHSDSVTVTEET